MCGVQWYSSLAQLPKRGALWKQCSGYEARYQMISRAGGRVTTYFNSDYSPSVIEQCGDVGETTRAI